jgi:hypothetical protein
MARAAAKALSSACLACADLQHGSELDQLRFVLVGVVLAEKEYAPRGQLGADASRCTAPVATVSSS